MDSKSKELGDPTWEKKSNEETQRPTAILGCILRKTRVRTVLINPEAHGDSPGFNRPEI